MIIEILIVLFIYVLILNTLYDFKVNYNRNGIREAHLDVDVNLNKNIVKFLKILRI